MWHILAMLAVFRCMVLRWTEIWVLLSCNFVHYLINSVVTTDGEKISLFLWQIWCGNVRRMVLCCFEYYIFGSTLTAVGRSQLLARWPGTHSWILSGIQWAAQTALGVYLKRTCSRVTSASSTLRVHNDYALYKSTHSLTLTNLPWKCSENGNCVVSTNKEYVCSFAIFVAVYWCVVVKLQYVTGGEADVVKWLVQDGRL